MIRQMAIAIALPGFNDLGRSVTPLFLLMDHFLYQFSTLSEPMKKIVLQSALLNSVLFSYLFISAAVSNAS